MWRPTLSDLALVGCAAAATTVLALLDPGHGWVDWAFVAIVFTGVALAVRMAWRLYREARRERDTAARLQAVSATGTARQAVVAERQRLARDIEVCVRESLVRVGRHAAEASGSPDPTTALRRVQAEAQRANTELRRQLGLLHPADDEMRERDEPVPRDPPLRFGPPDYLVVAAVVAVAAVDLALGVRFADGTWAWAVLALTLGSAATVVLRRVAPLMGALVCAALISLGAIIGAPVADGFSFPLAVGILAWSVASLCCPRGWATVAVLVGVAWSVGC